MLAVATQVTHTSWMQCSLKHDVLGSGRELSLGATIPGLEIGAGVFMGESYNSPSCNHVHGLPPYSSCSFGISVSLGVGIMPFGLTFLDVAAFVINESC